jgi:hypothetical protein
MEPNSPATADDWATFLRPLLAAVSMRPSREEFAARSAAIAFALPDVPLSMLRQWRQREALTRFKFLPSPAEIAEWLGPDLAEARRTEQLRIQADENRKRLKAPRVEPIDYDARREYARAKVEALKAAMLGDTLPAEAPKAIPLYLSEGALLMQYRALAADGNTAAVTRIAALEKRIREAGEQHA